MVASEKITLGDYAGRGPDGSSSFAIHVDDEGTPCQDVTIIEKGVLKNFLHSKETARRLGKEPTGNARAYSFSDEHSGAACGTRPFYPARTSWKTWIAARGPGAALSSARPTARPIGRASSCSASITEHRVPQRTLKRNCAIDPRHRLRLDNINPRHDDLGVAPRLTRDGKASKSPAKNSAFSIVRDHPNSLAVLISTDTVSRRRISTLSRMAC